MSKKSDLPEPPNHLEPETAVWWTEVVAEYDLAPSDLRILEAAGVQWDRAAAARKAIAASKDGPFTRDRFGQLKEHPAVGVEQNATRLFLAALRQLGLDMEPSAEPMRLPNPIAPQRRD